MVDVPRLPLTMVLRKLAREYFQINPRSEDDDE
jgi:hypothetical protein